MARQLIKAARARDDSSMPCVESICHNIYRWERGTVGLTERYKLYYCVALGISPDEFGAGEPEQAGDLSGFSRVRWRCSTWWPGSWGCGGSSAGRWPSSGTAEVRMSLPGSGRERMAVLPDRGAALRIAAFLDEHAGWSALWDKRSGVWRVSEDDPGSELYAKDADAGRVI
jgi:hypothetical protein